MKKLFGIEEITEYILGKLPDKESDELLKAIEENPLLQEMYNDLISKKDIIIHNDSLSVSDDDQTIGYQRFMQQIKNPPPAPGQIWKLKNIGWFAILSLNDLVQSRGLLLTNSIHYAMNYDIVFTDKNISFRKLVAHTHHIATINAEHFLRFAGNLPTSTIDILKKGVQGSVDKLPAGFEFGEGYKPDEFDDWNEYVREILSELNSEALEFYENPPKIITKIFELTSVDYKDTSIAELESMASIAEESNWAYSLASNHAAKFQEEEKIYYQNRDLQIRFGVNERLKGIKVKFIFTDASVNMISEFGIYINGTSVLKILDLKVSDQIATYTITDKIVMKVMAVRPVTLIIDAGKQFTAEIDLRK